MGVWVLSWCLVGLMLVMQPLLTCSSTSGLAALLMNKRRSTSPPPLSSVPSCDNAALNVSCGQSKGKELSLDFPLLSLPHYGLNESDTASAITTAAVAAAAAAAAAAKIPTNGTDAAAATSEPGSTFTSTRPFERSAKIVMLISDTGGGHRASAEALQEALEQELPNWDLDVIMLDIWSEHGKFPYNKIVKSYKFLGKHPRLWKLLYYWTASFPGRKAETLWASLTNRQRLIAALDALDPDMVVSVHPMTQSVPLDALRTIQRRRRRHVRFLARRERRSFDRQRRQHRRDAQRALRRERRERRLSSPSPSATTSGSPSSSPANRSLGVSLEAHATPSLSSLTMTAEDAAWFTRRPPFVTVVTDLASAHPMWFHRKADLTFVPSDVLFRKARWFGVPASKLRQHGLPVRRDFWPKIHHHENGTSDFDSAYDNDKDGAFVVANKHNDLGILPLESRKLTLRRKLGLMTTTTVHRTAAEAATNHENDQVNGTEVATNAEVNVPTVLVVGGGDGVGSIQAVVEELYSELSGHSKRGKVKGRKHRRSSSSRASGGQAEKNQAVVAAEASAAAPNEPHQYRDMDAQIVVVCGRNDAVRRRLEKKFQATLLGHGPRVGDGSGPNTTRSVRLQLHGFVDNMHEFMAASDVLVTKAGPGTIAEAAISGLPVLLNNYLPGQEAGNVRFVTRDMAFGRFAKSPRRIAETISAWLREDTEATPTTRGNTELSRMRANALAAARPHAAKKIAADLAEQLVSTIEATHRRAEAAAVVAAREAARLHEAAVAEGSMWRSTSEKRKSNRGEADAVEYLAKCQSALPRHQASDDDQSGTIIDPLGVDHNAVAVVQGLSTVRASPPKSVAATSLRFLLRPLLLATTVGTYMKDSIASAFSSRQDATNSAPAASSAIEANSPRNVKVAAISAAAGE